MRRSGVEPTGSLLPGPPQLAPIPGWERRPRALGQLTASRHLGLQVAAQAASCTPRMHSPAKLLRKTEALFPDG